MSEIAQRFGKRVAALRKRAGLTQAVLAERIGTSPEVVSRIEHGASSPALERVAAIARVLDVQISDLFPSDSPGRDDRAEQLLSALRRIPPGDADLLVTIAEAIAQRRASR